MDQNQKYSVFQSAEVQKLWVLGKRQEAKGKGEEKQVYLTSLGNAIVYSLEGFSHQEMKLLTDLSLSSIRSKASRGKVIAAKDGFTYLYDKNPQILKWLRT